MTALPTTLKDTTKEASRVTWRALARDTFRKAKGRTLTLAALYVLLGSHPKAIANRHYRAKLRQTVQLDPAMERVKPGVWRLKSDS